MGNKSETEKGERNEGVWYVERGAERNLRLKVYRLYEPSDIKTLCYVVMPPRRI